MKLTIFLKSKCKKLFPLTRKFRKSTRIISKKKINKKNEISNIFEINYSPLTRKSRDLQELFLKKKNKKE
jgi:hypothetical protein